MKRYLLFEIKRICRVLPFVLLAAVVLFGSLAAIYSGVLAGEKDSKERNPFLVALVGTGEDAILQMGISALDSMDSSRFALQVVQMEEPEARSALEQGVLSAYVVFPEGFMENAMRGTILPLRFVGPAGASNIVSILRIELTRVITDILDAAQKGTYGSVSALQELTDVKNPWPFAQGLALAYTQFILLRGNVYEAQSLGLSDGLGLEGHMLCGMIVLFLLLCTMPFSAVMIRKDRSLNRLLAAKGFGSTAQVLCEQAVLFAGFLAVIGSVLAAVFSIGGKFLAIDTSGLGIIALLPVIFTITAISFFLNEISSDLISGILLQFFLYVFLCFVSGCFYPGYFFPETMQHIGNFLPTGLSRMHIAGSITGQDVFNTGLALALWGAGFILLSVIVRSKKLKRTEVAI